MEIKLIHTPDITKVWLSFTILCVTYIILFEYFYIKNNSPTYRLELWLLNLDKNKHIQMIDLLGAVHNTKINVMQILLYIKYKLIKTNCIV